MTYSEPLYNQILIFVRSLGSGIIIGVIYSFFCCVRSLLGASVKAYVFSDGLFCLTAGTYAFFFNVVYNSGAVRFNILFSQVAGALLFYFALGRYLWGGIDRVAGTVRSVVRAVFSPFLFLGRRLCAWGKSANSGVKGTIKGKIFPFFKKHKKKIG